ncbi:hypothetical protein TCAP_00717 [Tolypocladium capitatum]|uniref:Uncharacterized protein n=1 Tax=Tolypocladium capitatum TaxID=45235 RepID=A0A2K3QPA7_9HYPO|nr:hypothetical protein TCAP_00717 [Tolypocladium capitatum]
MAYAEADSGRTVTIRKRQRTAADAIEDLRASSDDSRASPETAAYHGAIKPPPFRLLPICYWWT